MKYGYIIEQLQGIETRCEEPMSRHTSFGIGGPAMLMILPMGCGELLKTCEVLSQAGVEPFVMGNGTNLLIPDGIFDRIVVKAGSKQGGVQVSGEGELTADSGVSLARLAQFAMQKGYSGMEFAHGIPGTLGGAVCMNAGAYGGEMKDIVVETSYLQEGAVLRAKGDEHGFAYRRSMFSESVILQSVLRLIPGDGAEIQAKMSELMEKRRESQPLDKPSGGSFFKRPDKGYAAALIEQAGLKGFAVGGAQVSEKHAGFIINRGNASFEDVIRLMEHVQNTVYREFGVFLEPEVKIIR